MGRPGAMTVTVHKNENKPVLVQITGDAVVAFSGGRDSTYLVNYVKNVLGLSVLAVSLNHDFIPEETMNIKQKKNKQ